MTYQQTLQDQLAEFDKLFVKLYANKHEDKPKVEILQKLYDAYLQKEKIELESFLTSFAEKIAQSVREETIVEVRKWAQERAVRCAACFGNNRISHNHVQSDISDLLDLLTTLSHLTK